MSRAENPNWTLKRPELGLVASLLLLGACGGDSPAAKTEPAPASAAAPVTPAAEAVPTPSVAEPPVAAPTGAPSATGSAAAMEPASEAESSESGESTGASDLPVADLPPEPKKEEDEVVPTAKEIAEDAAKKSSGPDKDRKKLSDKEMLELLDEDDLSQDEFEKAFKDRKKQGVDLPGAPK